MIHLEERAAALLKAVGLEPAPSAAAGRYRRSEPLRRGVRYWSTSKPRNRLDVFGVQFFGDGCREAERLAPRLESRGFLRRNPQAGQDTFAKPIAFGPDGAIDVVALRRTRQDLDELLGAPAAGEVLSEDTFAAFRAFLRDSPLADTELSLPDRRGDWRPADF